MKPNFPALTAFEQTTIDPQQVRAYLLAMPDYFGKGWDRQVSKTALKTLNHLDYFEFHFKRYLTGYPKTLRRVCEGVRAFVEHDSQKAQTMIALSLDGIEEVILENEWYELMPRYELARSRIVNRFGLTLSKEYWQLLKKLEQSLL
jgi:hypothetical protein